MKVAQSCLTHGLYSPWNSPGHNTGVGSLSLLQWSIPTLESNRGLLHCRQILYQLSYQGSPTTRKPSLKSNKILVYLTLTPDSLNMKHCCISISVLWSKLQCVSVISMIKNGYLHYLKMYQFLPWNKIIPYCSMIQFYLWKFHWLFKMVYMWNKVESTCRLWLSDRIWWTQNMMFGIMTWI